MLLRQSPDAFDHRVQAVAPRTAQVLAKFQPVEDALHVHRQDFSGGPTGAQHQQNCDQAADDLRVAVGDKLDRGRIARLGIHHQPDVADAALNSVFFRFQFRGHVFQLVAQFNNVSVAVFPGVQELEILDQIVNRCCFHRPLPFLPLYYTPLTRLANAMSIQLGYCTNVHAGADLDQTRANLQQHALAVKRLVSPQTPLGIGLWLSAAAAATLRRGGQLAEFQAWLQEAGLVPFTFNGFPCGDFHQRVVKHRVYQPTWCERARLDYTLDLIAIQHQLLPPGQEGSISTLPLQWGYPAPSESDLQRCADNLTEVAEHLERLQQETDRLIYVCLEPEPGCVLQRSADVVDFFERFLLPGRDERCLRRHIRVCHDVCHAAVMFEDQADAIARYVAAGIAVGKVQVSSALVLNLDELAPADRRPALEQLRGFAEDRYLHQTCVRPVAGGEPSFFEDLPGALQTVADDRPLQGHWRVHFHVPIFVERFDRLSTSQSDIAACWQAVQRCPDLRHFEIETYAWTVLPEPLRQPTLAEGITAEIRWFQRLVS